MYVGDPSGQGSLETARSSSGETTPSIRHSPDELHRRDTADAGSRRFASAVPVRNPMGPPFRRVMGPGRGVEQPRQRVPQNGSGVEGPKSRFRTTPGLRFSQGHGATRGRCETEHATGSRSGRLPGQGLRRARDRGCRCCLVAGVDGGGSAASSVGFCLGRYDSPSMTKS